MVEFILRGADNPYARMRAYFARSVSETGGCTEALYPRLQMVVCRFALSTKGVVEPGVQCGSGNTHVPL